MRPGRGRHAGHRRMRVVGRTRVIAPGSGPFLVTPLDHLPGNGLEQKASATRAGETRHGFAPECVQFVAAAHRWSTTHEISPDIEAVPQTAVHFGAASNRVCHQRGWSARPTRMIRTRGGSSVTAYRTRKQPSSRRLWVPEPPSCVDPCGIFKAAICTSPSKVVIVADRFHVAQGAAAYRH